MELCKFLVSLFFEVAYSSVYSSLISPEAVGTTSNTPLLMISSCVELRFATNSASPFDSSYLFFIHA